MGKAGVNWDQTETWQRLVASIIASGVKLDLRQIALYYGTTYDTLENRLRKVKKDAAVLKDEVTSGQRGEVAPTRTKSVSSTPRKPRSPAASNGALETVANGRVTKNTPTKKKPGNIIKQEQFDNDLSFLSTDFTEPYVSFDDTPIGFDISNYENSFDHANNIILTHDDMPLL